MRAYAPAAGADVHACDCLCVATAYSASCAVDKSINRRAYASVYIRIRPYSEKRVGSRWPWSAFVIGWNACAGLRWPWKFNMFELWRRQSAYARVYAGRNRRQKYKQLRRQSAYARMKYKPDLNLSLRLLMSKNGALISWQCQHPPTPRWRHQMEIISALLAFVLGIHRWPVDSLHKSQ